MGKLDKQEVEIVRQLIINARISDNQVAKNTKIPVKTVNRKRKTLEQKGLLTYFTYLDTTRSGTGAFGARDLYLIILKRGITRKEFLEKYFGQGSRYLKQKHTLVSGLCEFEGSLCLAMVLESRLETDIIEIFNAEIVPELQRMFGAAAIEKTITMRLDTVLTILHNYIPMLNMKAGSIAKEWKPDNIFVDDTE
jgi:DNA-binding Lrp family transcriptional regulator